METTRALRILAQADTEGKIELLEYIQGKVFRIAKNEVERRGDSDVVADLDNLFDYLDQEIDIEKRILNSINKAIEEAYHDTI